MFQRIYTIWSSFLFILLFLISFPFFVFFLIKKSWKKNGSLLNKFVAGNFFRFAFIPLKIERRFHPEKNKKYIYCSNHFSYLDIPTMSLVVKGPHQFIGKNSLSKIPLFGFMFRKYHITVDRESMKDRYETIQRTKNAIKDGYNVIIFPEGGIRSQNPPHLAGFKEGAFKISIEEQIPIIPVTIMDNWLILPNKKMRFKRMKARVVVHELIEPYSFTIETVEEYKKTVYNIIDTELKKGNHESR